MHPILARVIAAQEYESAMIDLGARLAAHGSRRTMSPQLLRELQAIVDSWHARRTETGQRADRLAVMFRGGVIVLYPREVRP